MITDVIQVYGGDGVETVSLGVLTVKFRHLSLETNDTETVTMSFHTFTEAYAFHNLLREKIASGAIFTNLNILQTGVVDDHDDFNFERCLINGINLLEGHPVVAINLTDQTNVKWKS